MKEGHKSVYIPDNKRKHTASPQKGGTHFTVWGSALCGQNKPSSTTTDPSKISCKECRDAYNQVNKVSRAANS